MIKQGARCRNCTNKGNLYFIPFDRESGLNVISEPKDSRGEVNIYKLCKDCALEIEKETDIKTYDWSYEKIRNRDNNLDKDWHRKVYGCG